eukprot:3794365-Prymnesium_polylepis.1
MHPLEIREPFALWRYGVTPPLSTVALWRYGVMGLLAPLHYSVMAPDRRWCITPHGAECSSVRRELRRRHAEA